MGLPIMVLGESGTGKSSSLRNFSADEIKVINVAAKPLPFKNKFEVVNTDAYAVIKRELKNTAKKTIVIDDSQYLMANEFMRRANERGYDKFTEIAQNMWDLVNAVRELPNDVLVYFMTHLERDQNGNEKVKTIGKLLDEKITLEGMFTIVLKTNVTDGQYYFLTQNSGHDTVKSPMGMFSTYAIDNDLKYVDEKIRNYYELGQFKSDDEIAEIEKTVERANVTPDEPKKTRRTRRTTEPAPAPESEPEQLSIADEQMTESDAAPVAETAEVAPRRRRRRTE